MAEESGLGVSEELFAELVDCTPEPEPVVVSPIPSTEVSQSLQKQQATIEQTGADPPPSGAR